MAKYKNYWLILFALLLGIAFSLLLYFTLHRWEKIDKEYQFETHAQNISHSIKNELHGFENAMYSLGEFVNLSPNITREQFTHFTHNQLIRYPSILGFSWNLMISEEERENFLKKMANEGFPNLVIRQVTEDKKLIPDNKRAYYFPIYFIEPYSQYDDTIGINFTAKNSRHQAVKRAFNQDRLTVTEKLTIVAKNQGKSAILLLLPIYSNELSDETGNKKRRGILIEAISLEKLLSNALIEMNQHHVDIFLLDNDAEADQKLLYGTSEIDFTEFADDALSLKNDHAFVWSKQFDFADKKWKIVILPRVEVTHFSLLSLSWIAYISSLIFVYLFCFYWLKRHHSTIETVISARHYAIANKKLSDEIIERLSVEKKLIKFAHAFQLSADGINLLTMDGDYTYCNEASIELYGYKANEMDHLHYYDINQDPKIQELDLLNQVKQQETWHGEFPQTRKDGTRFPASISLSLIKDDYGNELGILEITRDITEATMMETQLQQAKKMEALGTLAGGIAHDFNNILASILGNSEMILMSKIDPTKTIDYVSNIQESCTRAADLVKQIMTFSRMETTQYNTIDIAKAVNNALTIIRASLPANIHISCSIDPHCPPIKGDVTQIHQILLNLCANASQAIGENGGTIAIDLHQEATMSYDNKKVAKDQIKLSVTDTGSGIAKEHISKVFDPFFTTKKVGEGTGLGLAVVNSIIDNHEGDILVKSEVNQGTSFIITFPTCGQSGVADIISKPVEAIEKDPDSYKKHVLIVEDEPHISKLYKEFITQYGYQTTVCEDGKQALAVFNDPNNHFDLVLTDQAMPNVTGKELCIILLQKNPKLQSLCVRVIAK